MNPVKSFGTPAPAPAPHLGMLLGLVRRRLQDDAAHAVRDRGLRISHARVLGAVPGLADDAHGIDLATVARRVGFTSQAAGQFATDLRGRGLVEIRVDPVDRRRRLVARTRAGDEVVRASDDALAAAERRWADEVGPERWAVARAVLEELAAPGLADLGGTTDPGS
ncbi:MAG: hypothetical protein CMH83_03755 [Nocardioides sp.]|nr:hypothetical protein [Nocardioides sp.]